MFEYPFYVEIWGTIWGNIGAIASVGSLWLIIVSLREQRKFFQLELTKYKRSITPQFVAKVFKKDSVKAELLVECYHSSATKIEVKGKHKRNFHYFNVPNDAALRLFSLMRDNPEEITHVFPKKSLNVGDTFLISIFYDESKPFDIPVIFSLSFYDVTRENRYMQQFIYDERSGIITHSPVEEYRTDNNQAFDGLMDSF